MASRRERERCPWEGLLLAAVLAACGDGATPGGDEPSGEEVAEPRGLVADPSAPFPELLSEVGLYTALPDTSRLAPQALAYVPRWELWSDGLDKARWLVLPKGGAVDIGDRARWEFPVGTLLFKTFSAPEGAAPAGPVETRVLRRGEEGWDYAAYLWNEARTDAALVDPKIGAAVPMTVDGEAFEHAVPPVLDCEKCHDSNPTTVIGFDELRLNAPAPGDEGVTQLERFAAAGVLAGALPAEPDAVAEGDPLTREVLGALHGNCAHCHNGGKGPATSFDMRHAVLVQNTVGKPTESSASASGIRIVPGSPEESILFLAFSGETDDPEVKRMPPIGVARRDDHAVELVRAWIDGLEQLDGGLDREPNERAERDAERE